MAALQNPGIDLRLILDSGQLFNWTERGGSYFVAHAGHIIRLRQEGDALHYAVFPKPSGGKKLVSDLFSLGRDFPRELDEFASDECVMSSVRACPGLSITRQDPWECLLSFIISQNNNIKRIRTTVLRLSEKIGEEVTVDGMPFHLFPSPESLASASLGNLRSCGLGYRAEYVKKAAIAVVAGFDLDALRSMDYESAKARLLELDGVGGKVADCVLVFGLGFREAFPVDLWIARIMRKHYVGRKMTEKKISEFGRRRFGKNAAVVHEYFFANRGNLCKMPARRRS